MREFPANWSRWGKRAGFIRNKEMVDNADALICLWDGTSRGTKMTLDLAMKKPLWVAFWIIDDPTGGFTRVAP